MVRMLADVSDMVSDEIDVELDVEPEYALKRSLLFSKNVSNSMNTQSPTLVEL